MRLGECYGIPLWAWGRRVELWVCFEGVKEHRHPGQRVEVIPVFGWAMFYRVRPGIGKVDELQRIEIQPRKWGRAFTVPAGWPHWFRLIRRWPLVFLNVTRGGSPAHNFK